MDVGPVCRVGERASGSSAVGEDGILTLDPVGQFATVRAPRLYSALECGYGSVKCVGLTVLVARSKEKASAIRDVVLADGMEVGQRRRILGACLEPEVGRAGRLGILRAVPGFLRPLCFERSLIFPERLRGLVSALLL